jgi:choline-sulfatase
VTGCYGNALVKTPNMDRLAARGVRFTNAYTPCPICVPARASLATGRWVHQLRAWDNAAQYHGEVTSWHHRLRDAGHRVTSIGKLHFRSTDDDNGFSEEILPLHVLDGKGDLIGALRDPPPRRGSMPAFAASAGPGESSYNQYDRDVTEAACRWLSEASSRNGEGKPWTLFVSLVRPHFPLTAPPEFFALYDPKTMPLPRLYDEAARPRHPAVKALRSIMDYDDYFENEDAVRLAVASYYALVSFLDSNVGKILSALEAAGLSETTRVIYTSDHGENLGSRSLWGKSVMYDESAAVPFIAAGPEIEAGSVDTPISLVDCYRSIQEAVGCPLAPEDEALPSRSIWAIANGDAPDRSVLSEYHAAASVTGTFMIRHGRWKYIHHVGFRPELFDMEADPGETEDLAEDPARADILAECEARLRTICDPDLVDAQAFEDQRRLIAAHGGREAVINRGDYSYTPAPGEKPVLVVGPITEASNSPRRDPV